VVTLPLFEDQVRLRPPLKWAGGKRWLVPYLEPLWERFRHRRLVEPFCGGLAVTLGLAPTNALLNDINPHLISFYQWLKRGFQIQLPMENDATMFYAHRAAFNRLIKEGLGESREAAELFYYLNRTGFNGLCRFNSKDEFNVPFGRYKTINYTRDFTLYRAVFARWQFTAGPFEAMVLEPRDFVYADPPYDVEFTSYAKEGFSWADQVRLAEWLAQHPGPVVLSNQATPRIMSLYERLGFTLRLLEAPRLINCTGDRTPAMEVVATRGLEPNSGRLADGARDPSEPWEPSGSNPSAQPRNGH
jgi:DNA adenine methylase